MSADAEVVALKKMLGELLLERDELVKEVKVRDSVIEQQAFIINREQAKATKLQKPGRPVFYVGDEDLTAKPRPGPSGAADLLYDSDGELYETASESPTDSEGDSESHYPDSEDIDEALLNIADDYLVPQLGVEPKESHQSTIAAAFQYLTPQYLADLERGKLEEETFKNRLGSPDPIVGSGNDEQQIVKYLISIMTSYDQSVAKQAQEKDEQLIEQNMQNYFNSLVADLYSDELEEERTLEKANQKMQKIASTSSPNEEEDELDNNSDVSLVEVATVEEEEELPTTENWSAKDSTIPCSEAEVVYGIEPDIDVDSYSKIFQYVHPGFIGEWAIESIVGAANYYADLTHLAHHRVGIHQNDGVLAIIITNGAEEFYMTYKDNTMHRLTIIRPEQFVVEANYATDFIEQHRLRLRSDGALVWGRRGAIYVMRKIADKIISPTIDSAIHNYMGNIGKEFSVLCYGDYNCDGYGVIGSAEDKLNYDSEENSNEDSPSGYSIGEQDDVFRFVEEESNTSSDEKDTDSDSSDDYNSEAEDEVEEMEKLPEVVEMSTEDRSSDGTGDCSCSGCSQWSHLDDAYHM